MGNEAFTAAMLRARDRARAGDKVGEREALDAALAIDPRNLVALIARGGLARSVEYGEALIFDDSIEHEAWNDSGETRTVLLFEIWRPELSDEERAEPTTVFEAIECYG